MRKWAVFACPLPCAVAFLSGRLKRTGAHIFGLQSHGTRSPAGRLKHHPCSGGPFALQVYCKTGCGNNIHAACMKIWAGHHKDHLTCPMCRAEWGPFVMPKAPPDRKKRAAGPSHAHAHADTKCNACAASPIKGARYQCVQCPAYNLCEDCFRDPLLHAHHHFSRLLREGAVWEAAHRDGTMFAGGGVTGLRLLVPTGSGTPRWASSAHAPAAASNGDGTASPDLQEQEV